MKDFNLICREFEQMDALSYSMILEDKAAAIIPALSVITSGGLSGIQVFGTFILSAIAADGKLSPEEYVVAYPTLKAFFKEDLSYGQAADYIKKTRAEGRELKKIADEMVDVIGVLDEDLKSDIILVCLIICAVDGKVDAKEKAWIRKLVK